MKLSEVGEFPKYKTILSSLTGVLKGMIFSMRVSIITALYEEQPSNFLLLGIVPWHTAGLMSYDRALFKQL